MLKYRQIIVKNLSDIVIFLSMLILTKNIKLMTLLPDKLYGKTFKL